MNSRNVGFIIAFHSQVTRALLLPPLLTWDTSPLMPNPWHEEDLLNRWKQCREISQFSIVKSKMCF